MEKARKLLKEYFGYDAFRKSQEEIINEIVNGNDVLAVMPTGGGKSICYQIPALIFEGITIVISPLISLMKDQVDNIKESGIKAAYINSSVDSLSIKNILLRAKNGDIKILYVAPERLKSMDFLNEISKVKVSQVAVDEAHCISAWGHDFRTSYRDIKGFIESLKERPIVTAFTATATKEVREDILKLLNLNNPKVFVSGFDRENLYINVIKGGNKDKFVLDFVEKNKDVSGIIYALTRKEVESIYIKLSKKGYKVARYHGGMPSEERNKNQEDFVYDRVNIIIATNAFGMGIDKSDIRYIIHYNMPQNIEGYYQEIGRAGRDNEKSECILLFSSQDLITIRYLIENSTENVQRKNNQYKKMQDMVDFVYTNSCYRKYLLNYFGETLDENCNNCSNCNTSGEVKDKTIDAQKVISCIYRMKRPFGTNMIVDVLRGSKNAKIMKLRFNELSPYGIMKEYTKTGLRDFINTLVAEGFLSLVEGEFPVVTLNNRSIKIVKGQEKVLLKEDIKIEKVFKANELFVILKDLRLNIAREEDIAPYIIFSDKTLLEMSNRYPKNKEEFCDISGVGELKAQKYGEKFIRVILEYMRDNNINKEFVFNEKEENSKNYDYSYLGELQVTTDKKLLKKLFEIREEVAKEKNIFPSSLIPLRSLKEISARYPKTIEELKDISMIGPAKIKSVGEIILNEVNTYLKENNIESEFVFRGKELVIVDGERRNNNEIAIDELKKGKSLEEISKEIEISVSTIMGYVYEYIKDGNTVDFNFDYSMYYNPEYDEEIKKAISDVGYDKVSLIIKKVSDNIKFENIRAYILKYIVKV